MAASPTPESQATGTGSGKINPNALAGIKHSLGEESVRDGRPSTDDRVVEAMDEETPAAPGLPER